VLSWVRGLLSSGASLVDRGVQALISAAVGGLASLLDTIFGNVDGAWHDLAREFDTAAGVIGHFTSSVWHHLETLVTHDIPVWAQGAYWWVTHPEALARVMLWPLLRVLEDNAWTAADWLAEFGLALLVKNINRVAQLAETVLAAIL
jgi:hypothetical protein